jgi:hypothetical protein
LNCSLVTNAVEPETGQRADATYADFTCRPGLQTPAPSASMVASIDPAALDNTALFLRRASNFFARDPALAAR